MHVIHYANVLFSAAVKPVVVTFLLAFIATSAAPVLLTICRTSSSAIAQRPHDALCLSVVSFKSSIRRVQSSVIGHFGFRSRLATDLPLCTRSSLLLSSTGCDKIHWYVVVCMVNGRPHTAINLKLLHGRTPVIDPTANYSLRITIFAYHTCVWRPRYGHTRRNIAIMFGTEKREWCGYVCLDEFQQNTRTNVMDRRTYIHRITA